MSRYFDRRIVDLDRDFYEGTLKPRGKKNIRLYGSPTFPDKSVTLIRSLNVANHIWTTGDNYYKLADAAYNDKSYWWVIGWYNGKPTDAMINVGDIIQVPRPLATVLSYLYGG